MPRIMQNLAKGPNRFLLKFVISCVGTLTECSTTAKMAEKRLGQLFLATNRKVLIKLRLLAKKGRLGRTSQCRPRVRVRQRDPLQGLARGMGDAVKSLLACR